MRGRQGPGGCEGGGSQRAPGAPVPTRGWGLSLAGGRAARIGRVLGQLAGRERLVRGAAGDGNRDFSRGPPPWRRTVGGAPWRGRAPSGRSSGGGAACHAGGRGPRAPPGGHVTRIVVRASWLRPQPRPPAPRPWPRGPSGWSPGGGPPGRGPPARGSRPDIGGRAGAGLGAWAPTIASWPMGALGGRSPGGGPRGVAPGRDPPARGGRPDIGVDAGGGLPGSRAPKRGGPGGCVPAPQGPGQALRLRGDADGPVEGSTAIEPLRNIYLHPLPMHHPLHLFIYICTDSRSAAFPVPNRPTSPWQALYVAQHGHSSHQDRGKSP